MIILLTGPTGAGKTDTSWELLKLFDEMVFLDCDWLAALVPFSWDKPADVHMIYKALATMIMFHKEQGRTNFVITLTSQLAQAYSALKHYFVETHLPLYAFRLTCHQEELQRRILQRDRLQEQKEAELKNALLQQAFFERQFSDERLFTIIDTTRLTEQEVALQIKKSISKPTI